MSSQNSEVDSQEMADIEESLYAVVGFERPKSLLTSQPPAKRGSYPFSTAVFLSGDEEEK